MKKIGFIDYYLDEWHANNYPELIEKLSGGEYKVCYAYGEIASPVTGMTNEEWSKKYNIELLPTISEVVEKSDYLIVLSPNNPEKHEELCELPLKSGKLTYIDKTFAPDKATSIRIFETADKFGTKCYSSSALRFCTEWKEIEKDKISKIYSEGPGKYEVYAIHQIEPIVMLMESRAKRVMFLGDETHPEMIIEFADGRFAHMYHRIDPEYSFKMTIADDENNAKIYQIKSDYFELFVKALVEFFDTGICPVSHEQTIDVMGILEAANKAIKEPFTWVMV